MSRTQAFVGKIKKVETFKDETLKDTELRLWIAEGENQLQYYEDALFDEYYNKYLKVNGEIWQYLEREELDPDDSYCNLTPNEDGTISFTTQFYNGGTYIDEMIRNELKKLGR